MKKKPPAEDTHIDSVKSGFENWWEKTIIETGASDEKRLRDAFLQVIRKMPKTDREKFLDEAPVIVCFTAVGRVHTFGVTVREGERYGEVPIIFLSPNILKRAHMIDDIAHEVAHIVRGDQKSTGYEVEKGADELSARWGFKPRYSKALLERIRMMEC